MHCIGSLTGDQIRISAFQVLAANQSSLQQPTVRMRYQSHDGIRTQVVDTRIKPIGINQNSRHDIALEKMDEEILPSHYPRLVANGNRLNPLDSSGIRGTSVDDANEFGHVSPPAVNTYRLCRNLQIVYRGNPVILNGNKASFLIHRRSPKELVDSAVDLDAMEFCQ